MKRAKYYILGAYLLIALEAVSTYYIVEGIRKDGELVAYKQHQVIQGLVKVWQELTLHINMN